MLPNEVQKQARKIRYLKQQEGETTCRGRSSDSCKRS